MGICISGDLKTFWTQLGGRRVDAIFEQVQNVLLLLKEKIKNGTATNQGLKSLWGLSCTAGELWPALSRAVCYLSQFTYI